MSFLKDFFQNLFGGNKERHDVFDEHRRYGERFRNPIWKNDEEDDDEYGDDERRYGGGNRTFHFEIFTNPFEMTRYFESEMDNMLKDFFSFGFGQSPGVIESFTEPGFAQIMPSPEQHDKSLRDEVLKSGYALPPPNYGKSVPKLDEDLDGKVTANDITQVWKDSNTSQNTKQSIKPWRSTGFRSFGQSVISQTIRRPDGTVEERRTVTDSEGNTETTIKRQLGDKTQTIVTKRDKDGVETQTENLVNMDEKESKDFGLTWSKIDEPNVQPGTLTRFPWHKFFGHDPKL